VRGSGALGGRADRQSWKNQGRSVCREHRLAEDLVDFDAELTSPHRFCREVDALFRGEGDAQVHDGNPMRIYIFQSTLGIRNYPYVHELRECTVFGTY